VTQQLLADAICERCEGRGWILEDDGGPGTAVACRCQAESVVPRLLAMAGIPERYRSCSFKSFSTVNTDDGQAHQLLAARTRSERYVDEFLTEEGRFTERGLLFTGPNGVGKTHLAVAVLSRLIERFRVHAVFADCTALIHRLQNTFEPGSPRAKRDVLDPILHGEILLLDDLGAQKSSEWVNEILYLILNERYSSRLPTLVTTNLRMESVEPDRLNPKDGAEMLRQRRAPLSERLPASLVSRLYQMTRPIQIEAGDFRR
jgi:DNA replication protein DnaC